MLFCYVFLYEQRTEAVNDKGGEPCDHALCDDNENRPFAAKLAFDRGDRCDAGCIQQAENQQAGCCERREAGENVRSRAEQYGQRGNDALPWP